MSCATFSPISTFKAIFSRPDVTYYMATTFLEFLDTWKCQGIRLRLGKRPKVREKLVKDQENLCNRGNLIMAAQQHNLTLLYSYCNSFLIRDVSWRIWKKWAFVRHFARNFVRKSEGFFSVWIVVTLLPVLLLPLNPNRPTRFFLSQINICN